MHYAPRIGEAGWQRTRWLRRAKRYHDLRGLFLLQNGLNIWFPFATYVRACTDQRLASIGSVYAEGWLVSALLVCGRHVLVGKTCSQHSQKVFVYGMSMVTALAALLSLIVMFIVLRAFSRLLSSQRYWAAPQDAPNERQTRSRQSSHWVSNEQWLAEGNTQAMLTRLGDDLVYIPPAPIPHHGSESGAPTTGSLHGSESWQQSGGGRLRGGSVLGLGSCWRCGSSVALAIRRLRWAPTVYLSSSHALSRLIGLLWFTLAGALALFMLPAQGLDDQDASCSALTDVYLAPLFLLIPAAIAGSALLVMLPTYTLVACCALKTNLLVMHELVHEQRHEQPRAASSLMFGSGTRVACGPMR